VPVASLSSVAIFYALVAAVGGAFVAANAVAGGRLGEPISVRVRWTAIATALLAAWLAVTGAIGASGALMDFASRPPPFLVCVALVTVATTVLGLSPLGARLARGGGGAGLVGFQAFRFPLELLLHRLYEEGVVPEQMTFAGRNFDILTGLLAIPVAFWVLRGAVSRAVVVAWNLLGLALLINIVTVAMLSAPVPFRVFMNEPANTFVAGFPFVWLPTVLVQAAWLGHLLVFRKLRGGPTR
jgi:hypothetical protein